MDMTTQHFAIGFRRGTAAEALSVLGSAGVTAVEVIAGPDDSFTVIIRSDDLPQSMGALIGSALAHAWTEALPIELDVA